MALVVFLFHNLRYHIFLFLPAKERRWILINQLYGESLNGAWTMPRAGDSFVGRTGSCVRCGRRLWSCRELRGAMLVLRCVFCRDMCIRLLVDG